MGGQAATNKGERKGDFLGGKYLLEDCLGIGGMGEVYRATNVSLGRKVAVKVLNKEHTGNEDDVTRFLREARAAAAIRHPNVVDVFDVARDDDGTPFIVQELLAGQDLEQYLGASNGRLSAGEALEIMIPVADAVAAAHKQNVVHRDLKPANIFLAREDTKIIPKVLDFGACLYQTVGALSAKERRMLIGTPHYMAPEQITTAMDVDTRADVWAMGVILYELLAGETPFEAEDGNEVLKLVRTRTVPPLRELAPDAPIALEELVTRCLDRDRAKRFADASVMREALGQVRRELKGSRKRADTEPELASAAKLEPKLPDSKRLAPIAERRGDPRADPRADPPEPSSHRLAALVLKSAKVPTKRRGSSILTLSSPDDAVSGDADPPESVSRPIDATKPARTAADVFREIDATNPARTAADVIREAEAATPREQGSLREVAFDPHSDPALELDFDAPKSRHATAPGNSSIPPVLDPRSAARAGRSDRPAADGAASSPTAEAALDKLRTSGITTRDVPLTPPLNASRSPRTPAVALPVQSSWTMTSRLTFGVAIVVPAAFAFVALRFAPMVLAPLGHAMRGDSPLASGVLAVLTLVGAAVLAARSFGSSRSAGMVVATVGAVLLGIIMIIVTFSASETAELEIPPAAGGIAPFIAPLIPLGLGLAALRRASSVWLSRYERGEALRFVMLTSVMLLAMLELGPQGAVRAATSTAASASTAPATAAPPAPARPAP